MPRIVVADPDSIRQAAAILRSGGVIAFPTETVYGLGARTLDERAIEAVYELKGRPADNPLIAHVVDPHQAQTVLADDAWNSRCDALASRFWPGPLTLVLRKSDRVGSRATAGRSTIAVRSPRHSVARQLIDAVGEPISAPSANRSGRVSPTTAQHVQMEFADVDAAHDLLILDGGACDVGIESTVLDMTVQPPRVLRHGSVTLEMLQVTLGEVDAPIVTAQAHSPGTSASHYAPRTPAELIAGSEMKATLARRAAAGVRCVVLCFDVAAAASPHRAIVMPRSDERYAHDLYERLRDADALGFDRIVIERPPGDSHVWRAVLDRLKRATCMSADAID
ncbi:MAG TPA: L-threonylcarbamoyladenylate synthase [Roseiflexaceae bacterium]|nr:L-threonylcarbamoyladenylate synthase [Roseiflexaceae bacterium]